MASPPRRKKSASPTTVGEAGAPLLEARPLAVHERHAPTMPLRAGRRTRRSTSARRERVSSLRESTTTVRVHTSRVSFASTAPIMPRCAAILASGQIPPKARQAQGHFILRSVRLALTGDALTRPRCARPVALRSFAPRLPAGEAASRPVAALPSPLGRGVHAPGERARLDFGTLQLPRRLERGG